MQIRLLLSSPLLFNISTADQTGANGSIVQSKYCATGAMKFEFMKPWPICKKTGKPLKINISGIQTKYVTKSKASLKSKLEIDNNIQQTINRMHLGILVATTGY